MKILANFWNKLINTQNSDKSEGGGAENIPSEEIARLNGDITTAFNYQGLIDEKIKKIIAVTKGIFGVRDGETTTIDNFERYLTQNKGESSFPNLLKEYEKFLRNTISQNKKEQNITFFSDNFACVGGTITRLELYNNPPFIEMIISLLELNAASFVSDNIQVHIIALLHFLAGFGTTDVHKFAPATDPSMTKEVMEEICKLTNPAALLDRIAREIAGGLLELGELVKKLELGNKDDKEIAKIINGSNVKIDIDTLIEAIQKAYPDLEKEDKELSLHEALQSPLSYLLDKEKYLPFSMVDKEDAEDRVDEEGTDDEAKKEKIKTEIIKGINKIIHKAEGKKNGENEINQYITEEQKAKFEQISKLFLIFIRGNHDYQLTIEDFNELVGKEEILIKPEDGENNFQYKINPEFEKILPDNLKKYFSDKFSPNFINPLIKQLESNKKISDAVRAIKSIDPPQKKEFIEEEKSLIVSALDKKCNGMNLLHILAKDVEVTEDQIKELLCIIPEEKKSLMIEEEDGKGSRPIHIAAYIGCIGMVKALIEAGANVDIARPEDGVTPLYMAAKKGHLGMVKALIEAGANVDQATEGGLTPLHMAAQKGHEEIAELLIDNIPTDDDKKKNYVNKVAKKELTALHLATQKGHLGMVKALIKAGADVVLAIEGGATPLHMAAQEGHEEIAELLIDNILIDKKDYVNKAITANGDTALHIAAKKGHLGIVESLIKAGADVDQATEGELTPLHIAAKKGHLGMVKALIEAGANVDQATEGGLTPLHMAAQKGYLGIVQALIDAGANVNQAKKDGATALDIAKTMGHKEIVNKLRESTPSKLPFSSFAKQLFGCLKKSDTQK